VLEEPGRLDPAIRDEFIAIAEARLAFPEAPRAYIDAANSLFWYLTRNLDRDLAVALRTRHGLMVFGDRDRLIDISSARGAAARHPGLVVEELVGIGHAPQLEAPELFVDVVCDWVERTVQPSPNDNSPQEDR